MRKRNWHLQNDSFCVLLEKVSDASLQRHEWIMLDRVNHSFTDSNLLSHELCGSRRRYGWIRHWWWFVFEHGITCLITIMAYRGGHNWNTAGALDFPTAVSISVVMKRSHRDTDHWTCVSSASKAKALTVTPSPVFVMIILQHWAAWLKLPGKLWKRRL